MSPPTHHYTLSHDSTLESISALLTQLYTLHLSLPSSSPSGLEILQPPHSPSPALLSQWKEAGMSDIVIETLKRLPYLSTQSSSGSREIAPDTLALNYLDANCDAVEVWKDPFCLASSEVRKEQEEGKQRGQEHGQQQGYLGNAIPLTSCIGINGCLLLLDLDSNHVYEIKDQHLSPPPSLPPLTNPSDAAEPHYYKHYPHKPALQALQQWIQNLKTLYYIYDSDTSTWLQQPHDSKDDWENNGRYDALKTLYLECGWPERFDGEVFMEKYTLMTRARGWDD